MVASAIADREVSPPRAPPRGFRLFLPPWQSPKPWFSFSKIQYIPWRTGSLIFWLIRDTTLDPNKWDVFFFPGSYQLFNYLQWMQMDRCCFFLTWKLSWTSHIIWVCLRIGYPQIPWFVIHLYTKWLFQPVAVRFLLSCCSECLWATLCLRNMHIYIIIHIYTHVYIYNYIYTHITHYIYQLTN